MGKDVKGSSRDVNLRYSPNFFLGGTDEIHENSESK
jgi:hypothetical protein